MFKIQNYVTAISLMQLAVMAFEDNARYGLDVDNPGASCADIYEKNPVNHDKSGPYLVKTNKLFLAQCDMKFGKGWMKVADLDMTRGDNVLKGGWIQLMVNGIKVCQSTSDNGGCYSTVFTVNGTKYHKIHGFVRGYGMVSTDGFDSR